MKRGAIIYFMAIMLLSIGVLFEWFDCWFIGGLIGGASLGVAYYSGLSRKQTNESIAAQLKEMARNEEGFVEIDSPF